MPVSMGVTTVSQKLGLPVRYLRSLAGNAGQLYRHSELPKKSGGVRVIRAPKRQLKEVQRFILDRVLSECPLSAIAYGGVKGRSDLLNATQHVNQPTVFCFDIQDFFPSVGYRRVRRLLLKSGFSEEAAKLLTRLTTVDYELPQGAPTSTYLGNLVLRRADEKLIVLCDRARLRVTRFVDDITISGECGPAWLKAEVEAVIRKEGFELKEAKFEAVGRSREQIVTGFRVNDGVEARSEYIDRTRQRIDEYLALRCLDPEADSLLPTLRNLHGRIAYVGRASPVIARSLKGCIPPLPRKGPSASQHYPRAPALTSSR